MFRNEMYNPNPEHKGGVGGGGGAPPMSPRISFSNDFVESSSSSRSHSRAAAAAAAYRDAPVSSDFEFSVSNYSMMSADELFFKGKLLPLKESCGSAQKTTTTLRDELRNEEDESNNSSESSFSLRPPKNPTRWRGFLGLRRSHTGSKKSSDKSLEKRTSSSSSSFHDDDDDDDDVQCTKNSQEFVD